MLSELFGFLLPPLEWLLRRKLSNREIAAFYKSWEWKQLRYEALKKYDHRCMCCGDGGGRIIVDHIKPIRKHPHLRLKLSNLQVLCNDCKMGTFNLWHP